MTNAEPLFDKVKMGNEGNSESGGMAILHDISKTNTININFTQQFKGFLVSRPPQLVVSNLAGDISSILICFLGLQIK